MCIRDRGGGSWTQPGENVVSGNGYFTHPCQMCIRDSPRYIQSQVELLLLRRTFLLKIFYPLSSFHPAFLLYFLFTTSNAVPSFCQYTKDKAEYFLCFVLPSYLSFCNLHIFIRIHCHSIFFYLEMKMRPCRLPCCPYTANLLSFFYEMCIRDR